jgi:hypothetical protein
MNLIRTALCLAILCLIPAAHAAMDNECAIPSEPELKSMKKREMVRLVCTLERARNFHDAESKRLLELADKMLPEEKAERLQKMREGLVHGASSIMCSTASEIVWRDAARRFGPPPACPKSPASAKS